MDIATANAASVAIMDGANVLLIERARSPYANLWSLPGGRREPGETAEDCAIREVHEELGLVVGNLVFVTTGNIREIAGQNWTLAIFATTSFSGEVVASDEIAAYRWVSRDELRKLRTTPGLDAYLELILGNFSRLQQVQSQQ